EQALELRAPQQPPAQLGDVERLDAGAIAREYETPAARVPEGEREHPVETLDGAHPLLFVEMRDHFHVRARAEMMATCGELRRQPRGVVYLPVADHLDGPVLVAQRLVSAGYVDDR